MNSFDKIISRAAENAGPGRESPGDYVGPDGLLICGNCGTRKQCRVRIAGTQRVVGCLCQCGLQRRAQEDRDRQEIQREMARRRLRRGAIGSSMLREASFQGAKSTPVLRKAKRYVENWPLAMDHNVGLLLMGSVGVGKSFAAACICNALLEQGFRCHMTSFVHYLAMDWEKRAQFLSKVASYDLLVLDDLGAECANDFSLPQIFSVVDERYRARKPLIVTTNLALEDLRSPPDNQYLQQRQRIYDRLLEVCGPVRCEGENLRQAAGRESRQALRQALRAEE